MRNDDGKLNDEIGHVNELLKNLCDSKGVFYMDNTNIDRNCFTEGRPAFEPHRHHSLKYES